MDEAPSQIQVRILPIELPIGIEQRGDDTEVGERCDSGLDSARGDLCSMTNIEVERVSAKAEYVWWKKYYHRAGILVAHLRSVLRARLNRAFR